VGGAPEFSATGGAVGATHGTATKNAVIGDHLAIKHRFAGVAHAMLGDDYPADLDRTVESEIGKCLPSVA
jgi:hypothetical protein